MAFSFFFSLTVILGVYYVISKKNLHAFEILFLWMVIVVILHNVISVLAVNLKIFDYSHAPPQYLTLVFNRVFLIPLMIIWFFDRVAPLKPSVKWLLMPLGVCVLTGVEYLAELFGVFVHTRWSYWRSLIEWFALFLIVNYSWIGYRVLLRKEAA